MDKETGIRRVKISGPPFERGFQLGNLCRREIENTLEAYRLVFQKYANIQGEQVKRLAAPFIDVIAKYDSEIMEEISGIAKALGRPVEDLVAINARTELMFMSPSLECTSIALLPEVTSDKRIFIGQNWDWLRMLGDSLILLEIEQPKRPTVLMLTEAGIVGKIGMNRAGIAVCLNILIAGNPEMGVPIHVLLRGILNAETLGDALGTVLRNPSGGCSHFLIGCKEGEAIGMEVGFHDVEALYPAGGIFTHANHFVGKKFRREDKGRVRYPDSLIRDYRALKLLEAKKKDFTLQDMEAVLRDHLNHPHSICRHPAPQTDVLEEIVSLASVLMDLKSGVLYVAEGPPCQHPYVPFSFS
ncbi:MAG: C45 family autoproteolytic acyltransferase/hydrolase [Thermodesulfobacteriota bacterium]